MNVNGSSLALFTLNRSWQCPFVKRQGFLSKCVWEKLVLIDNSDNTPKGLCIILQWVYCLLFTQNRSSVCWGTWVDVPFFPNNFGVFFLFCSSEFLESTRLLKPALKRLLWDDRKSSVEIVLSPAHLVFSPLIRAKFLLMWVYLLQYTLASCLFLQCIVSIHHHRRWQLCEAVTVNIAIILLLLLLLECVQGCNISTSEKMSNMKCLMTNKTTPYSICMWIRYMYMLHRRVFIVTCCNYGESSVSISSINTIFRIYHTAIGLDPR